MGRARAAVTLALTTSLFATAAVALQSMPPSQAARNAPAFRAGVDIVSLNVTVNDAANRYATDLDQSDFAVLEDGVKQDVTFFTRRRQPLALSLLLDSSASMQEHLPTLQRAATMFVRRLGPNDLAQVVDFDSRVDIRQPFTANQAEIASAIGRLSAGGATSLYNAIYIALRESEKFRAVTDEDVRRRALVVFSDGQDTSSLISFDELLDLSKRSDTAIYTIGLRRVEIQSRGIRDAEYVMRSLARETGGRSFFPLKVDDLVAVYGQIADELSSQYMLGYISTNQKRDGQWRRLVVQVGRPGLTARAKNGYFASAAR